VLPAERRSSRFLLGKENGQCYPDLTTGSDSSVRSDNALHIGYDGAVAKAVPEVPVTEGADPPAFPSGTLLIPAGQPPVLRSDVQRNRRALLQAAQELFAAGRDVPMYEVARRAGVGQATLYRHFPDRLALLAALAEEALASLEMQACAIPPGPGAFAAQLRLLAEALARSRAFMEVLQEEEKGHDRCEPGSLLHRLKERVIALVAGPLEQAKLAGTISDDVGTEDVVLVLAMVKGALDAAGPAPQDRLAVADRAVDLVLSGLLARAHDHPTGLRAPAGRRRYPGARPHKDSVR